MFLADVRPETALGGGCCPLLLVDLLLKTEGDGERQATRFAPGITQTIVLEFDVCPIADSTVNAMSGRPHQTQRCSGRCCRPIRRVNTAKQGTCARCSQRPSRCLPDSKKKRKKKKSSTCRLWLASRAMKSRHKKAAFDGYRTPSVQQARTRQHMLYSLSRDRLMRMDPAAYRPGPRVSYASLPPRKPDARSTSVKDV